MPAGSIIMKRRFREMTVRERVVFVFKVAVCVISFGFIYPHILSD